jgi:type IV pilus assembly protein PilV
MLLEALIAILIFSMGILAIVGMQAASIKQAGDAKYRSDANMLVNELVGQMWTSDRTASTLAASFATGGAAYTAWLGDHSTPGTVAATLPGADTNPPVVTVVQVPGSNPPTTASSLVTIRVFWQAPGEEAPHNHIAITQIK